MTKWPLGIKEILSKGIDGITRKDVLELRKKLMELNHYIVRKAIKKGEIYKEDKCFCCGVVGAATHPHHKNYFKPLDIAWVCSSCHVITHSNVRRTKNLQRSSYCKPANLERIICSVKLQRIEGSGILL